MKSKFLITILSIASLGSFLPMIAHQEVIKEAQDKIDVMLEEINGNNLMLRALFNLDKRAQHLYAKYRDDENFVQLMEMFNYIRDYDNPERYKIAPERYKRTHTHSFRDACKEIKEYLNGEISDKKRREIAGKLYIRYTKDTSFMVMRRLFEKIAKIQDAEKQNRYKEAMEAIKKLNRYAELGIGRHK